MSDESPATGVIVLAQRAKLAGTVADQYLCLTHGVGRAYRLFTADGPSLSENVSDIAPVEFDRVADLHLVEFLIESFWLLELETSAIQSHLDILDRGLTGDHRACAFPDGAVSIRRENIDPQPPGAESSHRRFE